MVREWHLSITLERILDAVERSMIDTRHIGICVYCGAESTAEPDARTLHCDNCHRYGVHGAEELLIQLEV